MKKMEALALQWFQARGWKPFPFQQKTWEAFLSGRHGLLNAPTGSGKTYALWVPIVLDLFEGNTLEAPEGLKALWITPLRALSVEIKQACESFVRDLGLPITVGIRTGDTTIGERSLQKKNMPNLLITTPESLHLLLASKGYERTLAGLHAVVVDEWHELLGSKRGVQVELALSRLRGFCPNLRIWGISATIGNMEQAREVLLGSNSEALKNSVIIRARISKKIEIHSIISKNMETFPWRGHLGLHLIQEVLPILAQSKTTLLFTNTRSQCELWYQALLEAQPSLAGELAMHHGSMDKATRLWVEQAIRAAQLRAVVCTSSLDLGVDFAPVETIIQIGGPKGVARFLQRAGRSGHRPGAVSKIYFLPTHALELVEASALKKAVKEKVVEDRLPYLLSFDVLIQYLTTLAVSDGFYPEHIKQEVLRTYSYEAMTEDEWQWLLRFITHGGKSLAGYNEFKKVEIEENGLLKVKDRGVAMRHRLSIGTIVGDAELKVKYLHGGYLGTVEEWFISKLQQGDVFTFAGRNLELVRIKDMDVLVRKSNQKTAKVPSWMGGRLSFSSQMSELLRSEIYEGERTDSPEFNALKNLFERQRLESVVPKPGELLIETFHTREGYHAVFYPFEGYSVHEAMASLLAYRISLLLPISFTIAYNDYGFELLSDQTIPMQLILDNNLFTTSHLHQDLEASLNSSEMAKRKFRDIGVIAGLVFQGYPSKLLKNKHLQSSTQLLFQVFKDYEADNLLFLQAFRETFEHTLEEGRLLHAMERINLQQIIWKSCEKPTPFSFPIITDRLREKLSSEKLIDRIKRMQASYS